MRRTQIYLTDDEYNYLRKEAYEKNLSMSEIIRNILDKYAKKKDTKNGENIYE